MTVQDVKTLYAGEINIEYGQFYIDAEDVEFDDVIEPAEIFVGQENGLCGAAQAGKLFFVTGLQNGVIDVEVALYAAEPDINEDYEEIVEVAFQCGELPVALCEWGWEEVYPLDLPKGQYGVRYCVIAMDADYDDDDEDDAPIDGQKHLIQLWPSQNTQEKIVKVTSEMASYWHQAWRAL
uniref:hypothetical protein n=1 Tax=Thaumasiovibrio occultus TaxID=1891184 RepID=UPI000B35491F|nr:hypothetical protein [Thaumasiovibrio occultus]